MIRILVVDDEPSIGKALSLGLSAEGVVVDTATEGQKAVCLGTYDRYDVLIVDLCLPDLDGIEVIKQIKKFSPNAISILITAHRKEHINKDSWRWIDEYLEKPLQLKDLKQAISRFIPDAWVP